MATHYWRPQALDIAQIYTLTVAGTWATSDTAVVTVGVKDLTLTVGSNAATTDVANAVAAMINGDGLIDDESRNAIGTDMGELLEVEAQATVSGSVVTVTCKPGIPITITSSETTAGTGTITAASTQAATGRHFGDNADNWSNSGPPGLADLAIFKDTDVSCLYGLTFNPTNWNIHASFTGHIGLPDINTNTSIPFYESRTTIATSDRASSTWNIGMGKGDGSGLIRLNIDGGDGTANIYNSAARSFERHAAIELITGATMTINAYKGDIYINDCAITLLNIGYEGNQATDVKVVNDADDSVGQTATTVNVNGGVLYNHENTTTLNQYGGTVHQMDASTTGTGNLYGGTLYDKSSGTATTYNLWTDEPTLDFSRDLRAKTVTTINKYASGSKVIDSTKRVSSLKVVGNTDNITWGDNSTLTRS